MQAPKQESLRDNDGAGSENWSAVGVISLKYFVN
jgi:hypothetical protein